MTERKTSVTKQADRLIGQDRRYRKKKKKLKTK